MNRLLIATVFIVLALPVLVAANVCVLTYPNDDIECYNEDTGLDLGFTGTQASCTAVAADEGASGGSMVPNTNDLDSVAACRIRICCSSAGNEYQVASAACSAGYTDAGIHGYTNYTRVSEICANLPPPETGTGTTTTPCTPDGTVSSACTCGGATITSGVCCSSGVRRDSLAQCPTPPPSQVCGDGELDTAAGEQCDASFSGNSGVACPGAEQVCTASCTCITEHIPDCGDGICHAATEQSTCSEDCDQAPVTCGSNVQLQAVSADPARYENGQVNLTWSSLPAQGCVAEGFTVWRSFTSDETLARTAPQELLTTTPLATSVRDFTDTTLSGNITNLIYTIVTVYPEGRTANTTVPVRTPNAQCPIETGSFCLDAKTAVTCTDYVPSVADCDDDNVCVKPEAANALCIRAGACEECNGLFEMYPDGSIEISEGTWTNPDPDYSAPRMCSATETCYRDLGATPVEYYKACADIDSCTGYRTEDACIENQCGRSGGCAWRTTDEATGRGVCAPSQSAFASSACNDCGTQGDSCDQVTCETIGQVSGSERSLCTYVPPGNTIIPPPDSVACRVTTETPCELFTTQDACVGPSSERTLFELDVNYDAQGQRVSGTNAITSRSNDNAGHGKCAWLEVDNQFSCWKDADDNNNPDYYDDPNVDGPIQYARSLDFTPPTTSITGVPGRVYPMAFSVGYTNTSPIWACFSRPGDDCYPTGRTNVLGQTIQRQFQSSESGSWELRYYGMDASRNLEEVKTFPFIIDGAAPIITITRLNTTIVRKDADEASAALATRVEYVFTVSEPSTCTTELRRVGGNSITVIEQGGSEGDRFDVNGATGESFFVTYPALVDGSFNILIDCADENGNRAELSRTFSADTDLRIYGAQPQEDSVPYTVTSVPIEIHTRELASCRYGQTNDLYQTTENLWNQFTPYTDSNGTRHNATVSAPYNGRYYFLTICDIDGVKHRGSEADFIFFGIDREAPSVRICDANQNPNEQCPPVDLEQGAEAYRLRLVCDDLPADSPRFGCDGTDIEHCVVPGTGTCTLAPGDVTDDLMGANPVYTLRYRATDDGGNVGPVREIQIRPADDTPPGAPTFVLSP